MDNFTSGVMNKVLMIKVYSYEGKNVNGAIYDVSSNIRYNYANMTQLILQIGEILDASEGGVRPSKKEIFETARHEGRFELVEGAKPWIFDKKRVFATFKLQVFFKKFDTWQGVIACIDSGNSNAFRSVLEMTLMMDSELEAVSTQVEAIV